MNTTPAHPAPLVIMDGEAAVSTPLSILDVKPNPTSQCAFDLMKNYEAMLRRVDQIPRDQMDDEDLEQLEGIKKLCSVSILDLNLVAIFPDEEREKFGLATYHHDLIYLSQQQLLKIGGSFR